MVQRQRSLRIFSRQAGEPGESVAHSSPSPKGPGTNGSAEGGSSLQAGALRSQEEAPFQPEAEAGSSTPQLALGRDPFPPDPDGLAFCSTLSLDR